MQGMLGSYPSRSAWMRLSLASLALTLAPMAMAEPKNQGAEPLGRDTSRYLDVAPALDEVGQPAPGFTSGTGRRLLAQAVPSASIERIRTRSGGAKFGPRTAESFRVEAEKSLGSLGKFARDPFLSEDRSRLLLEEAQKLAAKPIGEFAAAYDAARNSLSRLLKRTYFQSPDSQTGAPVWKSVGDMLLPLEGENAPKEPSLKVRSERYRGFLDGLRRGVAEVIAEGNRADPASYFSPVVRQRREVFVDEFRSRLRRFHKALAGKGATVEGSIDSRVARAYLGLRAAMQLAWTVAVQNQNPNYAFVYPSESGHNSAQAGSEALARRALLDSYAQSFQGEAEAILADHLCYVPGMNDKTAVGLAGLFLLVALGLAASTLFEEEKEEKVQAEGPLKVSEAAVPEAAVVASEPEAEAEVEVEAEPEAPVAAEPEPEAEPEVAEASEPEASAEEASASEAEEPAEEEASKDEASDSPAEEDEKVEETESDEDEGSSEGEAAEGSEDEPKDESEDEDEAKKKAEASA